MECSGFHKRKLLAEAGILSTKSLRRYLIEHRTYACVSCEVSEWCGKPLPLQMDHIDGNPKNNALNNVRWLCPNCHTQTETWGAQNIAEENRIRLKTNMRDSGCPPI